MQFSLETGDDLERRLIITVPAADVDQQVKKRLQDMSKRVHIHGFRPGKVPFKVVKNRYGLGARHEVLGEVIQKSWVSAITESELRPAGAPRVEPKVDEEGKDLEFVATFEVYPEITLNDFSSIAIEIPEAEVLEENIDTMIKSLRVQQRSWEPAAEDAIAEDGDKVIIDFEGTIAGEPFEGNAAKDDELILGSNSMIPGFESGIIGAKAGETRTLDLTFPENYHEEFKGKNVQFSITVNKINKAVLPELKDEFFAKFGVKKGGIEKFREEVQNNMKRELKQITRNKIKDQVLEGLLKSHTIKIPAALIEQEVDELRQQFIQRMQKMNGNENIDIAKVSKELPSSIFQPEAEKRVKLGLIVGEIIKVNNMEADEARVRTTIEDLASLYEDQESIVQWYYNDEKQLEQIKYVVLEDQVVDKVVDSANVTKKAYGYDEVIRSAQEKGMPSMDEDEVEAEAEAEAEDKVNE